MTKLPSYVMSEHVVNGVRYTGHNTETGEGNFAVASEWFDKAAPYRKRNLIAATGALLNALEGLMAAYESILDSGDCGTPPDWRGSSSAWIAAQNAIKLATD